MALSDWKPETWVAVYAARPEIILNRSIASTSGQEGHTVPVLRVNLACERWQQSQFDAPSYPRWEP